MLTAWTHLSHDIPQTHMSDLMKRLLAILVILCASATANAQPSETLHICVDGNIAGDAATPNHPLKISNTGIATPKAEPVGSWERRSFYIHACRVPKIHSRCKKWRVIR